MQAPPQARATAKRKGAEVWAETTFPAISPVANAAEARMGPKAADAKSRRRISEA